MQAFPIRLHAYSHRFLYQTYGFLTWDIPNHLQINRRAWEDHPLGMYLFLLGKLLVLVA